MARGKQTGCILPHQHDTNDVAPIIDGGTAIDAEHAAAITYPGQRNGRQNTQRTHKAYKASLHMVA